MNINGWLKGNLRVSYIQQSRDVASRMTHLACFLQLQLVVPNSNGKHRGQNFVGVNTRCSEDSFRDTKIMYQTDECICKTNLY
jgi:hypothetical protein